MKKILFILIKIEHNKNERFCSVKKDYKNIDLLVGWEVWADEHGAAFLDNWEVC